ncbi:uncharacterized protein PFL1_01923 [Pseudozyma flocculosa PF-1]|uniref:LIM zinc-binding domain-containing protein n=1 Tax=Pseudozyma flocculosa TaxID=84751 RepID=A0A5C3EZG6_9BASI|nr:uncharacterized protein PFL1_01923 [Pseudozyma flocculosa PF-1]EPQ30397.1 hypothetical protein PFL1_01923 [Pseudozyma flocculosa PF-1]SPO37472.1 uncharacterized protein PSFLO_02947 [Pseudozyma flocculosa]
MASLRTTYFAAGCQHGGEASCDRCDSLPAGKIKSKGDAGEAPGSTTRPDRWASRYVSGTFTPDDSYLSSSTSGSSVASANGKVPFRASTDHNLGLGMPSRISRDLRSSFSNQPRPTLDSLPERGRSTERTASQYLSTPPSAGPSKAAPSRDRSPNGGDYRAPILQGSDGALSKVCGSLVEPSESRNKWACHDCKAVFARDTTIYAPPSSAADLSPDGAYFCKQCYSARYGLGKCNACQRDVLGSTKEDGKFVKANGGLWHGRCWRCVHCGKGAKDGVEVLVGMDGRPCCEGCFDRPKQARRPSFDAKAAERPVPSASSRSHDADVRRLSRYGAAGKGAMGATIAELSKKFNRGCSTSTAMPTSPTLPSSPTMASDIFRRGSTSTGSLADVARPPSRGTLPFPDLVSRSPTRGSTGMSRSGSITGSPPKPRPLTAQFTGDLNLAAFRTSFGPGSDPERGHLSRSDSRSRSYSPTKRTPLGSGGVTPETGSRGRFDSFTRDGAGPSTTSAKVPGSPNVRASSSLGGAAAAAPRSAEFGRDRTASGFPRPLNTPFSKDKSTKEPLQGDKHSDEPDSEPTVEPTAADPPAADAEVRCVVCHRLPFESSATGSGPAHEVVMITLAGGQHLHADCFTCCVCAAKIDGSRTFTRLEGLDGQYRELAPGLEPFAHPHCAPSVRLQRVVRALDDQPASHEGRTLNRNLDPEASVRNHVTHQRELRPSPTPSPAATLRSPSSSSFPERGDLPFARGTSTAPTSTSTRPTDGSVRRFQPSAGAAPPTRSTILSRSATAPTNPAAGIFSRQPQPSTSSSSGPSNGLAALRGATGSGSGTTAAGGPTRLGGMPSCAFCGEKLSALESVTGPRSTAWHRNCLICRGAPKAAPSPLFVRNLRAAAPSICGKKLDSGAKVNRDGEVRCRDCFDRECSAFRVSA